MSDLTIQPEELGIGKLFERVRDAVIVADAKTQRIVLWNPAATRIFGYSAPEALKLHVETLVPEPLKAQHRAGITRYSETGHGPYIDSHVPLELPALRKGDEEIHIELSLSPIGPIDNEDGTDGDGGSFVLAIIRDITERKRAEEVRSRLAAIVESSDDAIIGMTLDGIIVSWNRGAQEIFGYTAEEAESQPISFLATSDRPDEMPRILRRVRRGEKVDHYETVRETKDGKLIYVSLTVSPIKDGAGNITGAATIARDVTKRREAEELRRQKDFYETLLKIQSDIGEGLLIVNGERIVYTNEAFCRISGYSAAELAALPSYLELIVPEDRAQVEERLRPRSGEALEEHYETAILDRGGQRVDLEIAVKAFAAADDTQLVALTSDITERKRAEESLKRSLNALLTLHEAGRTFNSTLRSDEIGQMLLEMAQRVSDLEAAVIYLRDERRHLRFRNVIGSEDLYRKAQNTTEAQAARQAALQTGERRSFGLQRLNLQGENSIEGSLVGVCLPLWVRDQAVGVLEAYGPPTLAEEATVELLSSLANQAAGALENARLYGELAEHERQLRELVGKLVAAQEEERRRVAHEVHDGLAQMMVAVQQHLQAFAKQHPPSSPQGQKKLDWTLELVQQTVEEARRVIAGLRPSALDDFGLATAIRLQVEALRSEGWKIDYEETLGDERLPTMVETALYRVAQEALTNVRKHAGTRRACLKLGRLGQEVRLRVRDRGRGFREETAPAGGGLGERVGISGMRERVALLGGELKVCSGPGAGTLVVAKVPLRGTAEETS